VRKLTPASVALAILAVWLIIGDGVQMPFADPPPFKSEKLCVVVVEETTARNSLTPGQREAMFAAGGAGSLREYVAKKNGELRILSQAADVSKSEPWVIEAMKVPRPSMPWLLAATPSAGVSKPLPADALEAVAAVKAIGGE